MRFDGLTAVVTGTASVIGRAVAELLAEPSAAVTLPDWNAGHKLGCWVGDYASRNSPATPSVLDVALPNLHFYLICSEEFMAGLREVIPNAKFAARVDGQAVPEIAHRKTAAALCNVPK